MALVSLQDSQVNRMATESEKGKRLVELARDPNRFLSTIQIGITLAGALASATAAVRWRSPWSSRWASSGARPSRCRSCWSRSS